MLFRWLTQQDAEWEFPGCWHPGLKTENVDKIRAPLPKRAPVSWGWLLPLAAPRHEPGRSLLAAATQVYNSRRPGRETELLAECESGGLSPFLFPWPSGACLPSPRQSTPKSSGGHFQEVRLWSRGETSGHLGGSWTGGLPLPPG